MRARSWRVRRLDALRPRGAMHGWPAGLALSLAGCVLYVWLAGPVREARVEPPQRTTGGGAEARVAAGTPPRDQGASAATQRGDAACAQWAALSPFAPGSPDAACEAAAARSSANWPSLAPDAEARALATIAQPLVLHQLAADGPLLAEVYLSCQTERNPGLTSDGCRRLVEAIQAQAEHLIGMYREGSDAAGELFVRLFAAGGMHDEPLQVLRLAGQPVSAEATAMAVLKDLSTRSAEAQQLYMQLR